MNWREKKKAELEAHLYETAMGLFLAQGYEATTMEKIAKEAGVAKGTFFNYFKSKPEILLRWYRSMTLSALKQADSSEKRGIERLFLLADTLAEQAMANAELWVMKSRYVFANDQLLQEEKELDQQILTFCSKALAEIEDGVELQGKSNLPLLLDLYLTVLTGTGHSWVVGGQSFDLKAVLRERLEFIFGMTA